MEKNNLKLTSVKVLRKLYSDFRKDITDSDFTLQKLVNRSLYLYQTDTNFKMLVENLEKLQKEHKNNKL
jgi:hypothetical protein